MNDPFQLTVPSTAKPYQPAEGIHMPALSVTQQVVDAMLSDPAVAAELRSRGVITAPKRQFRGGMWTAKKDGTCEKPVGWAITDAGRLVDQECGAAIAAGDRCWRQEWRFYGVNGCHPKGLIRIPKAWVEAVIMNDTTFASNLPDRRQILLVAQRLWQMDVQAGNITGEWGTDERKASEQRVLNGVVAALQMQKDGFTIPSKARPAKSAAPTAESRKRGISM